MCKGQRELSLNWRQTQQSIRGMWTTAEVLVLTPPRESAVTCLRHLGGQHPILLLYWLQEQVPSRIVRARKTPTRGVSSSTGRRLKKWNLQSICRGPRTQGPGCSLHEHSFWKRSGMFSYMCNRFTHTFSPQWPEEGIRAPQTGVTSGCELHLSFL